MLMANVSHENIVKNSTIGYTASGLLASVIAPWRKPNDAVGESQNQDSSNKPMHDHMSHKIITGTPTYIDSLP